VTDRARVRPTSRVVVLDPEGRVLLLGARLTDPAVPPGDVLYWYTPGGGVEAGEDVRTAAARELDEELGLVVDPSALEGPVWFRRHVEPFAGELLDNRETYFVLRDVVHEVRPGALTEIERLADEPHRWWTAAELAASAETFAPRTLPALLDEVTAGPWSGPPRVVD
jgi:8-oxo-dGTP pyrophosphatase MutT (NUDIX family)